MVYSDVLALNPLDVLKIYTLTAINQEPQFTSMKNPTYTTKASVQKFTFDTSLYENDDVNVVIERMIDYSLSWNFGGTLEWGVELCKKFPKSLIPNVIMIRAAIHKNRIYFTERNPKVFSNFAREVLININNIGEQFIYYLSINNGKKNNLPSIIKRAWAVRLQHLTHSDIADYDIAVVSLRDLIRITHPKTNTAIEFVMKGKKLPTDITSNKYINGLVILTDEQFLLCSARTLSRHPEVLDYVLSRLEQVIQNYHEPITYFRAIRNYCIYCYNAKIIEMLKQQLDVIVAKHSSHIHGRTLCFVNYSDTIVFENLIAQAVITAARSDEGYIQIFNNNWYPITSRSNIYEQIANILEGPMYYSMAEEQHILNGLRDEMNGYYDNIFFFIDNLIRRDNIEYEVYNWLEEYRKSANSYVNLVYYIYNENPSFYPLATIGYRSTMMEGTFDSFNQIFKAVNEFWDKLRVREDMRKMIEIPVQIN